MKNNTNVQDKVKSLMKEEKKSLDEIFEKYPHLAELYYKEKSKKNLAETKENTVLLKG